MAQKEIDVVQSQVDECNSRLQLLSARLNILRNAEKDALAKRPADLPPTWLPIYTERGGTATVTAWYDPDKWGSNCTEVS